MRVNAVRWIASWLGLVLLVWTAISPAAPAHPRQPIAITDVTIVDVENGRLLGPRTVLIDDGRIVAIRAPRDADISASAQRVDGRGRFLMPGLVDMHVHLFNLSSHRPPNDWSFPMYVANGVLGVRDMRADAASMQLVKQWRKAVTDGELIAPRILADGIAVQGESPEDAARQVDAAADAGAEFIKVFSEVPASHWRAIIKEAKSRSLPVVGHVPAGVPLLEAAKAGQRSDEHLMQAYEACSTIESTLLAEREGLDGDALTARSEEQEARTLDAFDPARAAVFPNSSPPPARCKCLRWYSLTKIRCGITPARAPIRAGDICVPMSALAGNDSSPVTPPRMRRWPSSAGRLRARLYRPCTRRA